MPRSYCAIFGQGDAVIFDASTGTSTSPQVEALMEMRALVLHGALDLLDLKLREPNREVFYYDLDTTTPGLYVSAFAPVGPFRFLVLQDTPAVVDTLRRFFQEAAARVLVYARNPLVDVAERLPVDEANEMWGIVQRYLK
jgi:hypothetical protein